MPCVAELRTVPALCALYSSSKTSDCSQIGLRPDCWRAERPFRASVQNAHAVRSGATATLL